MTQLLLIKEETYRNGVNNIGDVVGAFPDNWTFTKKEIDLFSIVKITADKAAIDFKKPEIKRITRAKTTEWTNELSEMKEVWQDADGKFKEIIKSPKFALSFVKGEIKENYSLYPENLTEIIISS